MLLLSRRSLTSDGTKHVALAAAHSGGRESALSADVLLSRAPTPFRSIGASHAEDSALRRNMPQHNNENEEALKKRRLTFAHSCSGVGSMGRS